MIVGKLYKVKPWGLIGWFGKGKHSPISGGTILLYLGVGEYNSVVKHFLYEDKIISIFLHNDNSLEEIC